MARRALEPRHRVEVFIDGPAVLEHLSTHPPPDALILDWQMPGISGVEVCQFLRSSPATEHLPVLMLTMHQQTRDLVEGLAAGADDFLTKPYNAAELSARVMALIRTKHTYDRLQQAERTVRALLRHLPEAVLTFGPEGLVRFANHEAMRMLARSEREMLGTHIAEILPELPWSLIRENRRNDLFTLPDLARNGRILAPVVRVFASPQLSDTALSFRDVTKERQAAESRLDLYSVVAHDLRAPLGTMIMRADRLLSGRRGVLPPDAAADVALMKQRLYELVATVSDFLDLARMEATEVDLARAPLDLRDLVSQVIHDFMPTAESKNVALALETPPEPLTVAGDKRRLTQVVSNLLSNAIKFSPSDATVRIECVKEGNTAAVHMHDTGPGIEPEAIPKLFSRYGRALDANHTVAGTGLGLMIVKQLVAAHGGNVAVKSEVAKGSTFTFALPSLGHESTAPAPLGTGAKEAGNRRTVLIVDDDDDLRDMIATELKDRGYYVLQAENGRVALDLLLQIQQTPDLMLLDIAMPVMSGTDLLAVLSNKGITPALPVVVLSGHAVDAKMARRVLRKPIPINLLMQVVDDIAAERTRPSPASGRTASP
jgi:two-component system phosphate regulon sensor histidine kinase PhoR